MEKHPQDPSEMSFGGAASIGFDWAKQKLTPQTQGDQQAAKPKRRRPEQVPDEKMFQAMQQKY